MAGLVNDACLKREYVFAGRDCSASSPPRNYLDAPAEQNPPPTMKSAFRLGLGAVLAVFLLWLATRGVDPHELVAAMGHARPFPLLLVVALTVVMYLIRAMRWRLILPSLKKAPILDLFAITNIGFMAGLVIPRAGEVLRPYLASRRYGVGPTAEKSYATAQRCPPSAVTKARRSAASPWLQSRQSPPFESMPRPHWLPMRPAAK